MKSINFHIRCIIQSLLTLVGRCARYSGVMYLSLMLGTLVTLFSVSSTVITAASCSSESHLTLASVPCIVTLCSHCARCCVRQVTEPSPQSHSATRPAQTGPGQAVQARRADERPVCDTGHVLPTTSTGGNKSKLNVCDV